MKFRDLNNITYTVNLQGYTVSSDDTRPRSGLHKLARSILLDTFPTAKILEEVPIKLIDRGPTKFIDLFVPTFSMVVEVHGEQHYKFNNHFHSSAQDFLNQKKRDQQLREWCQMNNLTYIELPYNEKEEQWRKRIMES